MFWKSKSKTSTDLKPSISSTSKTKQTVTITSVSQTQRSTSATNINTNYKSFAAVGGSYKDESFFSRNEISPNFAKVTQKTVVKKNGRIVEQHEEEKLVPLNNSGGIFVPPTFENKELNIPKLNDKPFGIQLKPKPLPAIQSSSSTYTSPYSNRAITTTTTTPYKSNNIFSLNKPSTAANSKLPSSTSNSSFLSSSKTPFTTTKLIEKPKPATAAIIKTVPPPAVKNDVKTTSSLFSSFGAKKSLKPGPVYIFNHEVFDNPANEYRVGSSHDVRALKNTFENFNMKVNVITNATVRKVESTIKESKFIRILS